MLPYKQKGHIHAQNKTFVWFSLLVKYLPVLRGERETLSIKGRVKKARDRQVKMESSVTDNTWKSRHVGHDSGFERAGGQSGASEHTQPDTHPPTHV